MYIRLGMGEIDDDFLNTNLFSMGLCPHGMNT